jgi:aryl-alcohol dehydrogenase-like predicted oxidoreductase
LIDGSADYGRSRHHLAHAWLLSHRSVCSVISGATKLEQMKNNAKAADWMLIDEEMDEINTILKG